MEPISSMSKMFDIIRGENVISSYRTEELKDSLYALQHENLTKLCGNEGYFSLPHFLGVIKPLVAQVDIELIARLEDALIEELRKRGENPPAKRFL